MDFFTELNPIVQALFATIFTWLLTAVGASFVFFMKTMSRRVLDLMLGFAAGVMIAASVWSLLIPAMDLAEADGIAPWLPALAGFLLGGVFLFTVDRILPHIHPGLSSNAAEGIEVSWKTTPQRPARSVQHVCTGDHLRWSSTGTGTRAHSRHLLPRGE